MGKRGVEERPMRARAPGKAGDGWHSVVGWGGAIREGGESETREGGEESEEEDEGEISEGAKVTLRGRVL